MASFTCPKCDITLKKGSWELYTHCPDCNEPWPVPANAAERNLWKIRILAPLFALLSLIPFVGVVFGIMGAFWGYVAIKFRQTVLGVCVMLFSTVIGIVCQGAFSWWAFGKYADGHCNSQLHTFTSSLESYQAKNHKLPVSSVELSKDFPAPKGCIYGGKYFYLPPWRWQFVSAPTTLPATSTAPATTSAPATAPAPAKGGKKPKDPPKPIAALNMPDGFEKNLPDEWDAIFKQANYELKARPGRLETTEAPAPSTVLLVAEMEPVHRYFRYCVTADLVFRELTPAQYEALLKLPQNEVFAKLLPAAKKVAESVKKPKAGGGH